MSKSTKRKRLPAPKRELHIDAPSPIPTPRPPTLPAEVLLRIFTLLKNDKPTLATLMRVSTNIHNLAGRVLYETVHYTPGAKHNLFFGATASKTKKASAVATSSRCEARISKTELMSGAQRVSLILAPHTTRVIFPTPLFPSRPFGMYIIDLATTERRRTVSIGPRKKISGLHNLDLLVLATPPAESRKLIEQIIKHKRIVSNAPLRVVRVIDSWCPNGWTSSVDYFLLNTDSVFLTILFWQWRSLECGVPADGLWVPRHYGPYIRPRPTSTRLADALWEYFAGFLRWPQLCMPFTEIVGGERLLLLHENDVESMLSEHFDETIKEPQFVSEHGIAVVARLQERVKFVTLDDWVERGAWRGVFSEDEVKEWF